MKIFIIVFLLEQHCTKFLDENFPEWETQMITPDFEYKLGMDAPQDADFSKVKEGVKIINVNDSFIEKLKAQKGLNVA